MSTPETAHVKGDIHDEGKVEKFYFESGKIDIFEIFVNMADLISFSEDLKKHWVAGVFFLRKRRKFVTLNHLNPNPLGLSV